MDPWHKVLEARALPIGADLMREFIVEALRCHDDGWRLISLSSFSVHFFATKERHEKRCVCIVLEDPATASRAPTGLLGPAAVRRKR